MMTSGAGLTTRTTTPSPSYDPRGHSVGVPGMLCDRLGIGGARAVRFPLTVAAYFTQRDIILAAYAEKHWGIRPCSFCGRWLTYGHAWCEGGCAP